ncbi:MAG: two-component regulator propeller domain-containing protein [Marinifilaceae bacterium]
MQRAITLLFSLILGFSFSTKAQQYNFRQYSLEEGLPQSEVIALIQDNRGNIWLGTNGGGVSRFNGKRFENYNRGHGLADNNIRALFQDAQGKLWIGTGHGISSYNGVSFKNYTPEDNLPNANFYQITEDRHHRIWAIGINQNQRFLVYVEKGKVFNYLEENPEFAKNNQVFLLFQKPDGEVLVSTQKGLFELQNKKAVPSPLNQLKEFHEQVIAPFSIDSDNQMWVRVFQSGGGFRIYRIQENKAIEIQLPPEIPIQRLGNVTLDSQQRLWIGIQGTGAAVLDGDHLEILDEHRGFHGAFVSNIMEDQEGNIWLATNGNGLIKYNETKFLSLDFTNAIGGNIVRGIFQDSKNYYWFAISGKGLVRYKDNQMKTYTPEQHPALINIRDFYELPNGHILMGGFNGIVEYDGTTFREVTTRYDLPAGTPVIDLNSSPQGLWISTFGRGVVCSKGQNNEHFNLENQQLTSNQISYTFSDFEGNAWFCHYQGMTRFDGDTVKHFNRETGLNDEWILQATQDRLGRYWFASYSGGINIWDGRKWEYLTSDDGITSDNVYSILCDKQGNIWAGTQNGVDLITYDKTGEITSIQNYNKFDGFTGIENNGAANFIDNENQLWFGTINGAMMFNPVSAQTNPNPPIIQLTDIRLFFKKVNWRDEQYSECMCGVHPWFPLPRDLRLPYKQRHLTFNFEALSYKAPEKVKYKWKLEGLDEEWSPVSAKNEAIYSNIPPGDYKLKIKASNSDGVWTPKPYEYHFTILTPWWQTWWFRSGVILLIILLTLLFLRLRIRNIQAKKRALEILVDQKTKEIRTQKTEIEQQNTVLEKQKDEILIQAQNLEKSYQDLIHLSEIGKIITAHLSIEDIIDTVYETVNNLMDASVFGIGIHQPEDNCLLFPRFKEKGQNLDAVEFALEDESRLAVHCFLNKKEIFIRDLQKEYHLYIPRLIPVEKTGTPKSVIYLPLFDENNVIGVITVQSFEKDAYQEYHLPLLQNIAVYAGIALENASAYRKIEEQSKRLSKANQKIKKKNEEIRNINIELLELNNEKNHLIGIIAHDLKNPLTSTLSIAQYMKEELTQNQRYEELENVQFMLKALTRMNEMVSKILDIKVIEAKKINLKIERTNLAQLMESVNQHFQTSLANKKLNLKMDCEQVFAKVDPNYMTQVYENLISNAIKFSPYERNIWVKIWEKGNNVCTMVKDEGPGLTSEDQEKLFGKFQVLSAKPTGGEKSTGLGLSIVKKYVEAMRGRVWCESQPGNGAHFYVELKKA